MTTDEYAERLDTALNNLLASVEALYHEDGVEYMETTDAVAVLQGRWLVAHARNDDLYLAEHTWADACAGQAYPPEEAN
jgi:hypothetical protein